MIRDAYRSGKGPQLGHSNAFAIGQAKLQSTQALLPRQPRYLLVPGLLACSSSPVLLRKFCKLITYGLALLQTGTHIYASGAQCDTGHLRAGIEMQMKVIHVIV